MCLGSFPRGPRLSLQTWAFLPGPKCPHLCSLTMWCPGVPELQQPSPPLGAQFPPFRAHLSWAPFGWELVDGRPPGLLLVCAGRQGLCPAPPPVPEPVCQAGDTNTLLVQMCLPRFQGVLRALL